MAISLAHVGALALGLVVQAFIMLFGKWQEGDFKKASLSLAFGFIGMMPGKNEDGYDVSLHIFISIIVAAFSFTMAFASRLIRRIGARTLLVINVLVVLVVCERFGYSETVFYILLVPTVITLINGFTNLDRHFGVQVFLYLWFCVMLLIIGLIQFALGDTLHIFGWGDATNLPSLTETFFIGGALMYILSNAWFVLYMIPVTEKHQSFENRMANIRKHMQLLAFGYVWQQGDTLGNLLAVIVFPVVLFMNNLYGIVDMNTLIFIILALIPFTLKTQPMEAEIGDGVGNDPDILPSPHPVR